MAAESGIIGIISTCIPRRCPHPSPLPSATPYGKPHALHVNTPGEQKQWTLTEPVHVQVHAKEAMPPCLSHFYVVCPPEQKLPVLRALIKRELGSTASGGDRKADPKADPKAGSKADTRGLVFALPTKSLEDIASSLDKALGGGVRRGEEEDGPEPAPMAEFLREELGLNARVRVL